MTTLYRLWFMPAALFLACSILVVGAQRVAAYPQPYVVNLRGHLVVPAVSTPAFGYGTLDWNDANDSLTYSIQLRGFTSNRLAVAFHAGQPFVNGPLLFSLVGPSGSADTTLTGRVYWAPELRSYINENGFYIYLEVDTMNYPAGEVRSAMGRPGWFDAVKASAWGRIRSLYK